MQRILQGKLIKSSLVAGEQYESYVPNALPPLPAIDMTEITEWLEKANLAVGELNGFVESGSDPSLINYMYIRKEAVLSSQIEGTQSTLDDLLCYEANGTATVPIDDVAEVSTYVAALNHGLKRVHDGFPLSLRLIREIHEVLQKTHGAMIKRLASSGDHRIGLEGQGREMRALFHLHRK
jgi:Fic family protein